MINWLELYIPPEISIYKANKVAYHTTINGKGKIARLRDEDGRTKKVSK